METRPSPESHGPAIVDLFLRRSPSLTAAIVTDAVCTPGAGEERRLVSLLEDGRLVGGGILYRPTAAPPGLGVAHVAVERAVEGRGGGSAVHAALEADPLSGATFLVGQVEAGERRSLDVTRHWGYEETEVSVTSRLALDGLSHPQVPPDVSADVTTDLEFADAEAVDHMLDVSQTNPERATAGATTLAQLRALAADERAAAPFALVLRVDGHPAAISLALLAGEEAQIFYTGVDPAYRGRGLALLAKRLLHRELAAAGARTAVTNNAEENVGIRRVNAALGYRRTGAVAFLRRSLTAG